MLLTVEEVKEIAVATADEVMARIGEHESDLDVLVGTVIGEGAIPRHGRETRKEPCWGCRIAPDKPLKAGNVMATTKGAMGILSEDEVRQWCSEIVEVRDGCCRRVRGIRQAAKECKEKHPGDTAAFFQCFGPAFASRALSLLPARQKRLTRDDVRVEVWEERDRLHIGIQDKETGDYVVSWWDDEAREMFEQGFFKRGRGLEESVLGYAEERGLLAR